MPVNFHIGIVATILVATTHGGAKWNGESARDSLYVNVSPANNRPASDSGYGISMHIQKVDIHRLGSRLV